MLYTCKHIVTYGTHKISWHNSILFSSGSRGPRGPGPPLAPFLRPQIIFWGPNCTFLHSNNSKFSKKFCLASLGILFQFSIDIFWSKTWKNYSFLRPQIIFWGPNCTFLHSNNRKIFQKIFNCRILIKNMKKLFIFEAPDYILRPKLHLFTLK